MTLYIRTTRGTQAALSASEKLTPELLRLLNAVDGRTDSFSLVNTATTHDGVLRALKKLRSAGYIVPVDEKLRAFVSPVGWAQTVPSALEPAVSKAEGIPAEVPAQLLPSNLSYAQQHTVKMDLSDARGDHRNGQKVLERAVTLMIDFVTENLSDQATDVVLEIQRSTTLRQLVHSLDDYERRIASTGPAGKNHMRVLLSVLAGS